MMYLFGIEDACMLFFIKFNQKIRKMTWNKIKHIIYIMK